MSPCRTASERRARSLSARRRLYQATSAVIEPLELRCMLSIDDQTLYNSYSLPTAFSPEEPACPCSCPCQNNVSGDPVRYGDGKPVVMQTDLASQGFGDPFSITRTWGDGSDLDSGALGSGWTLDDLPHMFQITSGDTMVAAVAVYSGTGQNWFDIAADDDGSNYANIDFPVRTDGMKYDHIRGTGSGSDSRLLMTSPTGERTYFYGFATNVASVLRGKFDKRVSPDGVTTMASYDGNGNVTEVVRDYVDSNLQWEVKESFRFEYIDSATNQNQLRRVTLRRKRWATTGSEPGSYTDIRRVDYGYYAADDSAGPMGSLRTAAISDPLTDRTVTITHSGTTATVSLTAHGYSVGDLIIVSGASDEAYNGTFAVTSVTDTDTFTYTTVDTPDADPTGTIKVNKPFDVSLYRYYTDGALKWVLSPAAYARLDASVSNPLTADESGSPGTDVASYADNYFEYDSKHRVTKEIAADASFGTYTFSYTKTGVADANPDTIDYNVWAMKTTETLPDLNQNIVYMNEIGQPMLKIFKDVGSGNEWKTFYEYNDAGQVILQADSSAITGYNDSYEDLLHKVSGNYADLSDTSGKIEITDYYPSDASISDTLAGDAGGYVKDTKIRDGETGTAITLASYDYFKRTNSLSGTNLITVYLPADVTLYSGYSGTNATGPRTTSYTYSWATNSVQLLSRTTQRPLVQYTQNGPGTNGTDYAARDTFVEKFNGIGEVQWTKDEDGYINFYQYDDGTGAVLKGIADIAHASLTAREQVAYPSGWSTNQTGLHLVTSMTADNLGRTTSITDPRENASADTGNVTYIRYNDDAHEVRTYPGWHSFDSGFDTLYTTTGPVQVVREDRAGSYLENLTFNYVGGASATPSGTESFSTSDIQTLSRQHFNNAGQMDESDRYATLSGTSYATAQFPMGTSGANFYATTYGYDTRGRMNKIVNSVGTISRMVYDGLGRMTSMWTGTNDTGWTPTNAASMTKTADYLYDTYDPTVAVTGDSNLTRTIRYPGGGASARIDDLYYDWRNRLIATKSGVLLSGSGTAAASAEDTSTHRPIYYYTYDNLDEVTQVDQYDGDQVWMTSTSSNSANVVTDGNSDGVPDAPSSSKRRAETTTEYDDQGRVWREKTFSVIQSGTNAGNLTSTNSLSSSFWYDHRGNLIKSTAPGGLVSKYTFDGAGRLSKQYVSDGGGDAAPGASNTWTDAGSVSGDNVLEQTETQYDESGNVIFLINKRRFHNETNTGELGLPATSPSARATYQAFYYDRGDRLTGIADYGTNGATNLSSRPSSSIPSRSDTVLVNSSDYNDAGWTETVTDSRNIPSKTFYDMLGRTIETVADFTDGTPTSSSNQTTDYTYDGEDHVLTMKAVLPNSGTNSVFQTTQYVYGVTTGGGSDVNSNDLLAQIKYPNKTTGSPSTNTADIESFTYNALGERTTYTDRNGTTHAYEHDVLNRLTADIVTTLGSGVDDSVLQLDYNYDTGGRLYQSTSRSGTNSSSTIVNQVQDQYNGLGQLTTEYQEHSGAVNTGTSNKVQYSYTEMSGGANNTRMTSMTYPNGRILHYGYSTGIDDNISRVSYLADDNGSGSVGQHLEEFSYLGLGTIVRKNRPENGTELTYIKESGDAVGDAGDQYNGLDRFDRVVDQRWFKTSGTNHTDLDRFQYAYDPDSNPLFKKNTLDSTFSELYHANGTNAGYDSLNRLTDFRRGTLSDANSNGVYDTVSSANALPDSVKNWSLDGVGNWNSASTGTNSAVLRTTNSQNEVTQVGAMSLTFDNNGNTTTDENGTTFTYDAWNHLHEADVTVTTVEGEGCSATTTTVVLRRMYQYDAQGRRISEDDPDDAVDPGDLYYDYAWRVVEEHNVFVSAPSAPVPEVEAQYVWSMSYIDDLVLRDQNTDNNPGTGNLGKSGSGLDQRLYPQNDANHNVTSLVNTSGSVLQRAVYDPYGARTILSSSWTIQADAYGFLYGHQGGRFDPFTGLYLFRMRDYSPTLGRWVEQDPLGYPDGANRYQLELSNPVTLNDAFGMDPYHTGERQRLLDVLRQQIAQGNMTDGEALAALREYDANREQMWKNNAGLADALKRLPPCDKEGRDAILAAMADNVRHSQDPPQAQPTTPNPDILGALAGLLGNIWASPNDLIGLGLGGLGLIFGGHPPKFGHNGLEFPENPVLPIINGDVLAITFGHIINYAPGHAPDSLVDKYGNSGEKVVLGNHEAIHTHQYDLAGPFFLPLYLLAELFKGKGGINPFEADADRRACP